MREILFRGKRKDNSEWVYGSLIRSDMFYWKKRNEIEYYICPFTTTFEYDECYNDSNEVVPETIGQFIGLLDTNGEMIFEGDIIKVHVETLTKMWDTIGVVKCYNTSYGIAYENDQHFLAFNNASINVRGYEVLGNIHDNPELLEAKNEN